MVGINHIPIKGYRLFPPISFSPGIFYELRTAPVCPDIQSRNLIPLESRNKRSGAVERSKNPGRQVFMLWA